MYEHMRYVLAVGRLTGSVRFLAKLTAFLLRHAVTILCDACGCAYTEVMVWSDLPQDVVAVCDTYR